MIALGDGPRMAAALGSQCSPQLDLWKNDMVNQTNTKTPNVAEPITLAHLRWSSKFWHSMSFNHLKKKRLSPCPHSCYLLSLCLTLCVLSQSLASLSLCPYFQPLTACRLFTHAWSHYTYCQHSLPEANRSTMRPTWPQCGHSGALCWWELQATCAPTMTTTMSTCISVWGSAPLVECDAAWLSEVFGRTVYEAVSVSIPRVAKGMHTNDFAVSLPRCLSGMCKKACKPKTQRPDMSSLFLLHTYSGLAFLSVSGSNTVVPLGFR